MTRLLIVIIALAAAAGCKKGPQAAKAQESAPAAAPAAPAQNAVTQHAADMQRGVQKSQDVTQKANAALQQNSQAIEEATGQ